MRKARLLALAAVFASSAASAAWYYAAKPAGDQLNDTLRSFGFLPITPPSNLMNLGSLYYVDPEVTTFSLVCHANDDDLKDFVIKSAGARTIANELDTGQLSLGIKLTGHASVSAGGNLGDSYVRKVHYSLADVQLYEIPLVGNRTIYKKLMGGAECNEAVMTVINNGYVCQGQKIMEATVEYDLRLRDGNSAGTTGTVDASALGAAIKVAGHVETNVQLVEKAGRLVSGAALKYGVVMNPICLAPPHARFERMLPRTAFDRFKNFVKFRLLEPILPGT